LGEYQTISDGLQPVDRILWAVVDCLTSPLPEARGPRVAPNSLITPPPPAVTTPPSPPRPSCYNHSTPRPLPTRSHLSHPPPWTVESRALHKVGGQAVQDPAAGGAVEWQGLHKAVSQAVQDPVAGVAVHSNSVNVWIHKLHLIAPSAHAAGIGAAVYGAYSVLLPPRPPRGRARCLRLLPLLGRQFLSDSIRFHHTKRGNSLHLRNLTYY
jgi:hypothetical protein